jgi:cbb3-type cytochrome oxidase subunit 3
MIQQLLLGANRAMPLFALLVFVVVFVGVLLRTFGRKASAYAEIERLPLDDDANAGMHSTSPRSAAALEGGRRG